MLVGNLAPDKCLSGYKFESTGFLTLLMYLITIYEMKERKVTGERNII